MIIESCVENLDEAVHAVNNGAHQVEICRDQAHDGLTPDENELIKIISTIKIPCKVMIRSRAGDFFYTHEEIQDMIREIQRLKSYRIDGFVFGALSHGDIGNITLDMASIYQICKAAYPIPVTIHKAIDLCTYILKEVEKLKNVNNVKFILSSGGAKDAASGLQTLNAMQKQAGDSLQVIAAGKITKDNLPSLSKKLKLNYFHGRKIV